MTDTAATTKPEMAGTEWMLPDLTRIPKDQLELRMDVYEDSIILTRFNEAGHTQWVRMVSADDIAGAFAGEIDYSSGLLPKDTLWWKQTETTRTVALWREPGVWPVALQTEAFKPPERLNLPMPGLVFVCVPGAPPWAFAAKQRPSTPRRPCTGCPPSTCSTTGESARGPTDSPRNPAPSRNPSSNPSSHRRARPKTGPSSIPWTSEPSGRS